MGHVELVAVDSAEVEAEAEKTIQFVYNPHYDVSAHEAGRIRLEAPKGEDLDRMIRGLRQSQHQRPLQMAQELVRLRVRRYVSIGMSEEMSPPPRKALTGELQVSLQFDGAEVMTVQLFSDDIIQIGQADGVHRYTDIVYGRPAGLQGSLTDAYAKISRKHCQIAWEDDRITLADGGVYSRNSNELRPSTNGTYFDGRPLTEKRTLTEGEIGIGPASGGLSLRVRLLRPSVCGDCCMPESERRCCCEGTRPCVMLKRSDVAELSYVVLWSCLELGCVDSRLKGLTIRRERGAFALQRNGESQWLADGMEIPLSESATLVVSPIWNQ